MAQDLSAYVPEIWANEAIVQRAKLTDISRLVTFRGAEFLPVGDTYKVSNIQALTTSAISTTNGSEVTAQEIAASTTDLLVNNWEAPTVTIKGKDIRQAINYAWEGDYMREAMRSLTNKVNANLIAEVANAGTTLSVTSFASIDAALIGVRKALNDNDVPTDERFGVVSTELASQLLTVDKYFTAADVMGKSRLLSAGVFSDELDGPMPGFLGQIYGFNIFESTQVVASGSPVVSQNMFFHRSAIMYLQQTAPLFDQDTVWYEKKEKALYISPDQLYGIKTMRSDHMVRLNLTA